MRRLLYAGLLAVVLAACGRPEAPDTSAAPVTAAASSSQPTTPELAVAELLESPTTWARQRVVISGTLVLDTRLQLCTSGEDAYPPACGRGVPLSGPGAATLGDYVACLAANEAEEGAFGVQIMAEVKPGPALMVDEGATQAFEDCAT